MKSSSSSFLFCRFNFKRGRLMLLPMLLFYSAAAILIRSDGGCSALSVANSNSSNKWKPKISNLKERKAKLRSSATVHDSETIGSTGFHHVEFYCGDAKSMASRFAAALGMRLTGSTGQHTGNDQCVSYGLQSGEQLQFLLTAPYSTAATSTTTSDATSVVKNNDENVVFDAPDTLPGFSPSEAHQLFAKHGLFARAVGLSVKDAAVAFDASVARGAKPVLEPTFVSACPAFAAAVNNGGGGDENTSSIQGGCYIAEVELYGDVVLRYVSFPEPQNIESATPLPFLPHLAPVTGKIATRKTFGLQCIDHAVGNVPDLLEALNRIAGFTGFHEFAEFTSQDVGTVDSGLNSVVLASDTEHVLLPLNEPVQGKRKSQIQTYLEQNEGAGLQHLALKTNDIFETIRLMRNVDEQQFGMGFELMKRPSDEYYRELPDRLAETGQKMSEEQYEALEELGILADADDEGLLLQIFTKPIGDRPTFFFEIIQRVGCLYEQNDDDENETSRSSEIQMQMVSRPGCGGFGQGNFRELFKSIEEHEKTLKV